MAAALRTTPLARSIHTGTTPKLSGGYGHENDYMHAKHMYNITEMKNRKLKFGTAMVAFLTIGYGTPIVAVLWQQHKASG
ncbi:hypothetical protein KFL_005930060 [Klebsormidium nitens]|uniref:SLL1 protein n=1 Tax=Klebsormidium nitens TaxID=105231 RepID=A0A0U9HSH7_KLENI|nr:hypothetical protein KFL_005930060 [Klebsormidium nitens]|eukprot:GAQ90049.1 hypothetical protein KFL_005930060 [Klebsormidium nitens]